MRTQPPSRRAFTLVELLVVISIIAMLVGLLFPAVQAALRKAEASKAKSTILSIATAFKAYDREYSGWPSGVSTTPQNVTTNLFTNPRGIVFLDVAIKDIDSSGNILDPWKNPYRVAFDPSGRSSIPNPFTLPAGTPATISADVIVWSIGPDGQSSDNGGTAGNIDSDNIVSW